MADEKYYLNEVGLRALWKKLDDRDTKVVEKLKNLEERMDAQENKMTVASGVAYVASYGSSVKPIVGIGSEYTEESGS